MVAMSSTNWRALGALAAVSLLFGCTATGGGSSDGSTEVAAATPEVVQGTCPNVSLREGTAYYRTYSGGNEGDPSSVVHQASIADATRQCTLSGSEIVVNVAAAGRVVAGPAGGPGTIQMPIRVAAVRGDEVLYSELTQYSTTLDGTTGQFLFSDPNVRIPAAGAENVRIFVGFDEGPYDTP